MSTRKNSPPKKIRKITSDIPPQFGYYATPIQKVIRKWRYKIGDHICQHYLGQLFIDVTMTHPVHLESLAPGHNQFIGELLLTLIEFWEDTENPQRWMLKFYNPSMSWTKQRGYNPYEYEDIRKLIIAEGGPNFTVETLATTSGRLRLTAHSARK